MDVIGLVTEAKEDSYGLLIKAAFSAIERAQEVRQLITEGIAWGLSVGFELLRYEENRDEETGIVTLHLLEGKLAEATVTVKPMNELAIITGAKSLTSVADLHLERYALEELTQIRQAMEEALAVHAKATGPVHAQKAENYRNQLCLAEQAIRIAELGG